MAEATKPVGEHSRPGSGGDSGRYRRWLLAAIAVKIAIIFVFAVHTRLVMDEFWQLSHSRLLFTEYFDTVWPSKAVGYAVFYKLAHVLGWDSVSTILIARLQTALLGCGTIAMVYACARSLGQDRLQALLVVLILLSFSNFEERIFRTNAEPLSLFFATAALLLVLQAGADRPMRLLVAGIASGLSFLATQKGVYFNLALGLGLVLDALANRRIPAAFVRGSLLVAGWASVIAFYCLAFGVTEPLPVLRNLIFGPVDVAFHGADPYPNLTIYVWQTLERNALLYLLCFAGMALAAIDLRSLSGAQRTALVFSAVMAGLVFTHNQPWPYVFIMALPFLALWGPVALDRLRPLGFASKAAWAVLIIAIVVSLIGNLAYLRFGIRSQLDLVARAEAMLGPRDAYFDGTGMLPRHRQSPSVWLDRGTLLRTLEEGKESAAYRGLNQTPPNLIIDSYRTAAVASLFDGLLTQRYVRVSSNIRLLGARLRRGQSVTFDIVQPGRYALYDRNGKPLEGRISIGGRGAPTPLELPAGVTQIELLDRVGEAILVREGEYRDLFNDAPDDETLFAGVYD